MRLRQSSTHPPKSKNTIPTPVMLIAKAIPMRRSNADNIPRNTGRLRFSVPAGHSGLSSRITSSLATPPISAFVSGLQAQYCVSGSASSGKPKSYLTVVGVTHAAYRRSCKVADGRSSRTAIPFCKSSRETQSRGHRRAQYHQDVVRAFPCRFQDGLPSHLRYNYNCPN